MCEDNCDIDDWNWFNFICCYDSTYGVKRMWSYERAETCLSSAMEQTMSEVMEENHYGIENRNEMLAALLQSLIAKWNHEIDLTVLVHKMDYDKRQMDVEVCGRMNMDEGKEETVSVRRKIVFEKD